MSQRNPHDAGQNFACEGGLSHKPMSEQADNLFSHICSLSAAHFSAGLSPELLGVYSCDTARTSYLNSMGC